MVLILSLNRKKQYLSQMFGMSEEQLADFLAEKEYVRIRKMLESELQEDAADFHADMERKARQEEQLLKSQKMLEASHFQKEAEGAKVFEQELVLYLLRRARQ